MILGRHSNLAKVVEGVFVNALVNPPKENPGLGCAAG